MGELGLRLGLLGLCAAESVCGDWQGRFREGARLSAESRAEEAIAELKAALSEATAANAGNHQLGGILNELGLSEFRLGRYRSAKSYLERSIAAYAGRPENQAVATANLGLACQSMGDFAKAEKLYRQAMRSIPDRPQLWHQLGQALFLQGRFKEAEEAQRRVVELAGENEPRIVALALSELATLSAGKKDYRQATDLLERAMSLTPPGSSHGMVVANLAHMQQMLGQLDLAARGAAAALAEVEASLGPDHPQVGLIVEFYAGLLKQANRQAESKAMSRRAEAIRSALSAQTNSQRTTVDWRDLR